MEDFTTTNSEFGQDQKWTAEYLVKLKIDADLKDLQYVMDLKVAPELDDDELDKLTGDEARMQARFTSVNKGCRDWRSHGRGNDDGLTLEIAVPSSVFDLENVSDHSVDLVAVWACGHEAIQLTHSIAFVPKRKKTGTGGEKKDVQVDKSIKDSSAAEVHEVEHGIVEENNDRQDTPLAEDTPSDDVPIMPEPEVGVELEETARHHEIHKDEAKHVDNESKQKPAKDDSSKKKVHQKSHGKKEDETIIRKFNSKYNHEDFGRAKFTANSYLVGMVVFIFVGGTVLNAFRAVSYKPRPNNSKTV